MTTQVLQGAMRPESKEEVLCVPEQWQTGCSENTPQVLQNPELLQAGGSRTRDDSTGLGCP